MSCHNKEEEKKNDHTIMMLRKTLVMVGFFLAGEEPRKTKTLLLHLMMIDNCSALSFLQTMTYDNCIKYFVQVCIQSFATVTYVYGKGLETEL